MNVALFDFYVRHYRKGIQSWYIYIYYIYIYINVYKCVYIYTYTYYIYINSNIYKFSKLDVSN